MKLNQLFAYSTSQTSDDSAVSEDLESGTRRVAPVAAIAYEPVQADHQSLPFRERPTLRVVAVSGPREHREIPHEERATLRCLPQKPAFSSLPPLRPSVSVLAIGSFERVPVVLVTGEALTRKKLDPRGAFILTLLDGHTSIESVLDACPFSTHQALRILGHMVTDGIIALR